MAEARSYLHRSEDHCGRTAEAPGQDGDGTAPRKTCIQGGRRVWHSGSQSGAMFVSRGHLDMSRDILLDTTREGGVTGIQWVEAKDAAEYPTVHRAGPTTLNSPAPSVNRAKIGRPLLAT